MRDKDELLKGVDLFYPSAREWMWNYCIYLGAYSVQGEDFDLGIYLGVGQPCAAIVHGNEPGDYSSGELYWKGRDPFSTMGLAYTETRRRAEALGLYINLNTK